MGLMSYCVTSGSDDGAVRVWRKGGGTWSSSVVDSYMAWVRSVRSERQRGSYPVRTGWRGNACMAVGEWNVEQLRPGWPHCLG